MESSFALYDQNAYQDCFSAKVLSCVQDTDNEHFHVILDQTCFFPEQGGQSADIGRIKDDVNVLDVQIKNGIIEHLTNRPLEVGSFVSGKIDFTRRFDFMQHHTGEHIFSGLVYKTYGFHNVGFHLSDRTVSMDYDGFLTVDQVRAIEWEANQFIWKNLPVEISWPDKEELDQISYRSKKEISGKLRLVTIPEVDVCACCAPHVKRTGEIGQLMVVSSARYKGGTRLHILCGGRALKAARQDAEFLSEASQLLSCSKENLASQIKAIIDRENELVRMLEESKAEELKKMVDGVPLEKKNVILSAGQINEKTSSEAADRLSQLHSGVCGILFADGLKQRVVLVSRTIPLRTVVQVLRQSTGFKGGGDDGCIRGMIDLDAEQLEKWLDQYTD